MKIKSTQDKQEISPITIELKIETKRELEILVSLFGLNVTAPKAILGYKNLTDLGVSEEEIKDLMRSISYNLVKFK